MANRIMSGREVHDQIVVPWLELLQGIQRNLPWDAELLVPSPLGMPALITGECSEGAD